VNPARKILLVTNDFGPRAGGIETFILGLLEQLDGSQVVVYTSSQAGSTEFDNQLLERMNVVVIRDKAKILLPTPRVNRDVTAVLKKYDCRTVWFGAAAPLGWMAPKLRTAGADKIISLSHGHEVWWCKVPLFSAIMNHIGNSLDVMTYLGSFTKSALEPVVGKKVKLIRIAPGIDVEHFVPGAKSPELLRTYGLQGKKVILSVGRLVHRKGQDRLIQAMPKILQSIPDARLLFVGEGPYKSQLVKLVEKYKLQDYVQFVGRLTYPELPKHIQLGDVFVMPSRSRFFGLEVEGLGIVYLEASACGLPVIAGDSGGAPDAVLINETGLVVDGTKISEIAEATISLLSDPDKSHAFGKRGREWIESDWEWQIWGQRFKALL
jgi:phosphatidylinositol alpha-1,6-mannosyltransferase